MKHEDLLRVCLQNLLRRKSRTILTVLGVLIGCCSIVIMVSLGIGMKESQEKLLSELGDLTIITVTAPQKGHGKKKLDDKLLKEIRALDGVEGVTPKLGFDAYTCRLLAGPGNRYVADWSMLAGLDTAQMDKMGYQLTDGTYPAAPGEVAVGQYFAYNFRDTLRPEGANTINRWDSGMDEDGRLLPPPDAYFDPLKQPLTLEVTGADGSTFTVPLKAVGAVKEDNAKGYETSDGVMMSVADLQALLKRAANGRSTPNSTPAYDSVLVKVSGIKQVDPVETAIKNLGYSTESMESIRKPMEKEARQKQMMLGGLGAISLIVAALGITNTMIMSISERTKEIGVMKSLGCYVYDIRVLFLAEAGAIGFIGGVIGSVISFLISLVINLVSLGFAPENFLPAMLGAEGISRVSVIPPWLYLFALVFSVFIGLGSGYYPANKAVQIPALEAIKSE
ncbi:ABC transporter permease [Gemmiger formicilis]|uniref:ABC transporter permease n=1 Tax=Gemmiger formicilis TaxID=745368 RepID=UPI00195AFEAD|nr:ABC transporter permease [Gemmiger formicilis]MBM6717496.1 ABC transporter permease [Gemmiger formicilis]